MSLNFHFFAISFLFVFCMGIVGYILINFLFGNFYDFFFFSILFSNFIQAGKILCVLSTKLKKLFQKVDPQKTMLFAKPIFCTLGALSACALTGMGGGDNTIKNEIKDL